MLETLHLSMPGFENKNLLINRGLLGSSVYGLQLKAPIFLYGNVLLFSFFFFFSKLLTV